jgi:thiosulfate dehydrogenase (quinone) large subunit
MHSIFQHILWIEISILNIIGAMRYSEIRENGIYNYFYFYRWDKIKSYNWISSDTLQFNATLFKKINLKFKFTIIEKKDKLKIDEILKRYIISFY